MSWSDSIRRILVIRPDQIGDLLLITPVLRALKKKCPGVEITACIKPYTAPIACRIPEIDVIFTDRLLPGQYTWSDFWQVANEIRARQFDLAIHFTTDYPYTLISFLAGIRYRVGDYARLGMRPWLNMPVRQHYRDTSKHEIEHNYDLCNIFDSGLSEEPMSLRVSAEEVQKFRMTHQLPAGPLLAVHLGTGGGNKPWLPESYAMVCDQILQKFQMPSLVIGSPAEQSLAQRFMASAKGRHHVMVGKTDLSDLPLAIACGDYFLGVDSGPMHIAAALQKPTVAIFPTKMVKAAHWGPWHVPQEIVHMQTACELRCVPRQCALETCLKEHPVDAVFQAVSRLIEGHCSKNAWDQKLQRIRKTLGIGFIHKGHGLLPTMQTQMHQVKAEGFQVRLLQLGPWQVSELAAALNAFNLHVLVVPSHVQLWRVAAALTGSKVFIPPLVITPDALEAAEGNVAQRLVQCFNPCE